MNCYYCKGVNTMDQQSTRFCAFDIDDPFIMENVPASVCRLCGEKSYSEEVISAIEKINRGEAQVIGFRAVKVFDFRNLDRVEDFQFGWNTYLTDTPWVRKAEGSRLIEKPKVIIRQEHSYDVSGQPIVSPSAYLAMSRGSNQPLQAEPNPWLFADRQQNVARYGSLDETFSSHVDLIAGIYSSEFEAEQGAMNQARGYHDHLRAWQDMGRGRRGS